MVLRRKAQGELEERRSLREPTLSGQLLRRSLREMQWGRGTARLKS
jgi:hypothetical protein